MKKKVLLAMTLVMGFCTMQAQENQGAENWEQMRTERVKKQAERKAGELDLKGDAKDNFIIIYTQYQGEMFACAKKTGMFDRRNERREAPEKKELTDAEAKEKVDEYFKNQEKQITLMKARLDVQKKYYAEFAKTLTPQQLAKVFAEPQFQMGGRGRQGQGRPGGFGGQRMRMGEGPQN